MMRIQTVPLGDFGANCYLLTDPKKNAVVIDPAESAPLLSYFEKTDNLKKRIDDLRVRRSRLISEDEDERCIEELRHLKRLLNGSPRHLSEMDRSLFDSVVSKIYAEQNGDMTFCLIGGLQFRVEVA